MLTQVRAWVCLAGAGLVLPQCLHALGESLVHPYDSEQIKTKGESSLVCAAKYEVEHSENSLEFPTLYAVSVPV